MSDTLKPYSMITDFVTGKEIPNVGAEENRQMVERFLVAEKGFSKEDIAVDVDIEISVAGETYRSQIDLVVSVDDEYGSIPFMAIKCAAASLGSREREILAAARLLAENQLPFSVVSDGKTAIVLDTVSGKNLGEGLNAILSKAEARERLREIKPLPFPKEKREREKLIFRSFDSMNVNVGRNL
ncbi:MAG: type I restriction enzyme HsdR N-terminal domain-containing protein [Desulfobacterales bacterium]